jgi:hypothetical protein
MLTATEPDRFEQQTPAETCRGRLELLPGTHGINCFIRG